MLVYIEKSARGYPLTQAILAKLPKAEVIYLDNYKNIFDKKHSGKKQEKSIIIAKLTSPAVSAAPPGYGHTKEAYFFKTSLGCVFDCQYCFLKGAFRNEHMVFFVNYDDIKKQIHDHICALQNNYQQKNISCPSLWFYSSDWSDIQGMDVFSDFNTQFLHFFENYQGVHMEIRTKSANIQSLLSLGFVPKNTEIAFSLNPQKLIENYEQGTAHLDARLAAIQTLLDAGFRVGIRLLPLLPVKNYKQIYSDFFAYLREKINISQLDSSFASGLLYTKEDYKVMLKKYPRLDILHYLQLENDDFYRESRELRTWFYKEIKNLDPRCIMCLES